MARNTHSDPSTTRWRRARIAILAVVAALALFVFLPRRTEAEWRVDLAEATDGLERSLAVIALGSPSSSLSRDVVFDLLEATMDVDPAVSYAARFVLRKRATDSAPFLVEIAFGAFVSSPFVADAAIRNEAVNVLAMTENVDAVRTMIRHALDPNHPRRDLVMSALAQNAGRCSLEVIGDEIARESDFPLAAMNEVIEAAMTKPKLRAREILVRVGRERPEIRNVVLQVSARMAEEVTPPIMEMLEELSDLVGEVLVATISRIAYALEAPNPKPRFRLVAESLGPRSAQILAVAVQAPTLADRERARAVLGMLVRPESRFEALKRIDLDDPENQALIASMLAKVQAKEGDLLIGMSREPAVASRKVALLAMERLPTEIARFRPELERLTRDADDRVRAHAQVLLDKARDRGE